MLTHRLPPPNTYQLQPASLAGLAELEEVKQLGCVHGEEAAVLLADHRVGNVQFELLEADVCVCACVIQLESIQIFLLEVWS